MSHHRRDCVTLRQGEVADADTVAQVFFEAIMQGAARDYDLAQRQAWAGPAPSPDGWRDRLATGDIVLAQNNATVLGFAALNQDAFDLLFVHPEWTGQGVARTLHARILDQARGRGGSRLTVFASHSARPFFEKQGWTVVRANQVERHGVVLDDWLMVRAL